MNEQQYSNLLRIVSANKKMLTALHQNLKAYHWIEGYAVGCSEEAGLDGKRTAYVLLFGFGAEMDKHCVKVYKSHNRELPMFIQNAVNWENPDEHPVLAGKSAMKKGLIEKGRYVACPSFSIITRDGKETEQGKQNIYAGVVDWSQDAIKAEDEARNKSKKPETQQKPTAPPPDRNQKPVVAQQPEVAKAKKTAAINPNIGWQSMADAIEWADNLRIFLDKNQVKAAYGNVKESVKPASPTEMWVAWQKYCYVLSGCEITE